MTDKVPVTIWVKLSAVATRDTETGFDNFDHFSVIEHETQFWDDHNLQDDRTARRIRSRMNNFWHAFNQFCRGRG